ncbi:MAG: helix-turn-helix transcriptional regulator [bacterium]
MRTFRSLLLKKIDIRMRGLAVLRLRLHKHIAQVDSVRPHNHTFGQLLCYMSNGGTLHIQRDSYEIATGTLAWIAGGRTHSFQEHRLRRPLCLAIDLRIDPQPATKVTVLNHSEAARIRTRISEIGRLKNPASIESSFLAASHTLAILDIELRALGFLPREAAPTPAIIRKFQSLASDPAFFHSRVEDICKQLGQDVDYLNRLHKRHTGLSLLRQRDAYCLERCKKALNEGGPVSEAAESCGFEDMNYFSRWFRRQTGMSPSEFAGRSSNRNK